MMLRRQFLSQQPPCILILRRQASVHSKSRNPSIALSSSLKAHGLTPPSQWDAKTNGNTIQVIDPQTKKEITIDLDTVQPFTPEFALLPLQYRTIVEQRHLFNILRERQSTSNEFPVTAEEKEQLEPDPDLVKKYVAQAIENRRRKTDVPPSESRIKQYIEKAKAKALKNEKKPTSSDSTLSFEEQWRRREDYGTEF